MTLTQVHHDRRAKGKGTEQVDVEDIRKGCPMLALRHLSLNSTKAQEAPWPPLKPIQTQPRQSDIISGQDLVRTTTAADKGKGGESGTDHCTE